MSKIIPQRLTAEEIGLSPERRDIYNGVFNSTAAQQPLSEVYENRDGQTLLQSIISDQARNNYFTNLLGYGPNLHNQNSIRYARLNPQDPEYVDPATPLVIFSLAHAKAWDGNPAAYMEAEMLRRDIGADIDDDHQPEMLILPNTGVQQDSYRLDWSDRIKVGKEGDLTPLTDKDLELIEYLKVGKDRQIILAGTSFGSARTLSLASALLERGYNVSTVLAGAPPDAMQYKKPAPLDLRKRFAAQGRQIKPEVRSLGIDRMIRSEIPGFLAYWGGLGAYTITGNAIPTNHAFNRYYTKRSFSKNLSRLLSKIDTSDDVRVGILYGDNDTVVDQQSVVDGADQAVAENPGVPAPSLFEVASGNHLNTSFSVALSAMYRHIQAARSEEARTTHV